MGKPIVDGIFEGIKKGFAAFDKVTSSISKEFIGFFKVLIKETKDFIKEYLKVFSKFAEDLKELFETMANDIKGLMSSLLSSIKSEFSKLNTEVLPIITAFKDAVKTSLDGLSGIFKGAATLAIKAMKDQLETLATTVIPTINTEFGKIKDAYDGKTESAYLTGYALGAMLVLGTKEGIYGVIKDVEKAVQEMVARALGAAKEALDSHSPSRKARDEIGKTFGQGVVIGILDEITNVENAVEKMLNPLTEKKVFDMAANVNLKYNEALLPNADLNYNAIIGSQKQIPLSNQSVTNTAYTRSNVVNNMNKPEYHLHMTVAENQVANVKKNFKVAQFIGI